MTMPPKWQQMATDFLNLLADRLGNDGCNDWSFPPDWTEAERREFTVALCAWNRNQEWLETWARTGPPNFVVVAFLAACVKREVSDHCEEVKQMVGKFVLVRTYSAGIHCGTLAESNGTAVLLKNARRIWRWRGANSLHELSIDGAAKEFTRISKEVEQILLTQAVEIIPCTARAQKNLEESRWGS